VRPETVSRDWANLWQSIVAARFTTPEQQQLVLAILAEYSGPEPDRVKLGMLKAADCDPEKMRSLLRLANAD